MPTSETTFRRSRTRRAGESAIGMLLLVKRVVMGIVALIVIAGGAWTSWSTAVHAMTGDERGTVRIEKCVKDVCTGSFEPTGAQANLRGDVRVDRSISGKAGQTLDVVVVPGTKDAVRTGPTGIMHAWVPLGGAFVLAALVIAGGMGFRRTALVVALLGIGQMAAAWALLSFHR